MKVRAIRSDIVYKKMMDAPPDKKEDIYRYELMKAFEKKFERYHCPLKAKCPGGYDVLLMSDMMGYLSPKKIDHSAENAISLLADEAFWQQCRLAIEQSLKCFTDQGINLPIKEYLFTILLADPESPYSVMNDNYCGDGGIPGYLFGSLVPSGYTMERLPVALAHETNHNVRFQYFDKEGLLQEQLTALSERKERLEVLIKTMEKTISSLKGDAAMTDAEKFEGFKRKIIADNEAAYGQELRERYGEEAIDASNRKVSAMSASQWKDARELGELINQTLKEAFVSGDPAGKIAQKVCDLHRQWLCMFWQDGTYSKEAHKALADGYVSDERFTAYYDKIAIGCTKFLRDAIYIYCSTPIESVSSE